MTTKTKTIDTAAPKPTKGKGAVSRPEGAKHAGGRPRVYGKATQDKVIELIEQGQPLTRICRMEGMPVYSRVCEWLAREPEFAEKYARARQIQADFYVDEMIDIADTEKDPQLARVRIDARKWHASKTAPKKYGDKIEATIANPDGSALSMAVNFVVPNKRIE